MIGRDVVTYAHAGSGRVTTLAIVALQTIQPVLPESQALILTPTRELGNGIQLIFKEIGKFTTAKTHLCIPSRENDDRAAVQEGAHILVGTAGFVLDRITRHIFRTKALKLLVLDELESQIEVSQNHYKIPALNVSARLRGSDRSHHQTAATKDTGCAFVSHALPCHSRVDKAHGQAYPIASSSSTGIPNRRAAFLHGDRERRV